MHSKHPHASRRDFLQSAAVLTSGLVLGPRWSWADEVKHPESADVGIARGSNMEEATRRAVKLAGGMDFIKEGQTVLIKPNVTGAIKHPTTTSPEVLYATIKLVAERGPKRIIVADRSFSPLWIETVPKTVEVMRLVGHLDAVNQAIKDAKAPVVAVGLEDAAAEFERLGKPKNIPHWRRMKPKLATHWPDGFELAELLFAVDHVINVPVIKTHFQSWFTMAMKAFVGMSHHRSRREFHGAYKGSNDLGDQMRLKSRRRGVKIDPKEEEAEVYPLVARVAELNLGVAPALNILDGTQSFVFGGPSHGDTAEGKVVVASRDRIAADVTGVAILKHLGTEDRLASRSPWQLPFIKHGIKIGLGIDSVKKLKLHHQGMEKDIEEIKKMLT